MVDKWKSTPNHVVHVGLRCNRVSQWYYARISVEKSDKQCTVSFSFDALTLWNELADHEVRAFPMIQFTSYCFRVIPTLVLKWPGWSHSAEPDLWSMSYSIDTVKLKLSLAFFIWGHVFLEVLKLRPFWNLYWFWNSMAVLKTLVQNGEIYNFKSN